MEQLPDGRWRWERGQTQPLCYECKAVCDLYRYRHNGGSLWFCSPQCADKWAADNNAEADHIQLTITDREPYNGAAYGYSPFDMDARECKYWALDHLADDECDDDDDCDCCDDAEDYGEE